MHILYLTHDGLLDPLLQQKDLKTKCRAVALQELSLQKGVQAYDAVYRSLR